MHKRQAKKWLNITFQQALRYTVGAMKKAEINQIGDFLSDVYEGIYEQDPPHVQRIQLNELYGHKEAYGCHLRDQRPAIKAITGSVRIAHAFMDYLLFHRPISLPPHNTCRHP